MFSNKKKSFSLIEKGLKALSEENKKLLFEAGVSDKTIDIISILLHKYSNLNPTFIFETIAWTTLSHAPDKGLLRFERFLESTGGWSKHASYGGEFPFLLASVFSTSGMLSNRLISDFALAEFLSRLEKPLEPRTDKDFYLQAAHLLRSGPESLAGRIRAVHTMHTVHLMRICARDAYSAAPLWEISEELSALAEAVIESCLSIAFDEMTSRQGSRPSSMTLFVLGLGKLGGKELNVSSDIDLIYLCDEPYSWTSFESMRFYTTLSERLTELLSGAMELGYLYRVDTRLRADGSSGPLVRTTADYLRYLEMRGEAWERQMLLKARPVAGNIEGGGVFLESLERFIFHTSLTRSPNQEIVALKNQIEARLVEEGSKKTHLKLAPGGIRDIESIVQCLQLLMGGLHPEVRSAGTLDALRKLRDVRALNPEEYDTLRNAYILYRRIENALQWREFLPAFNLPTEKADIEELSAYLGIPDLAEVIERSFKKVRAIYNEIFNADVGDTFEASALRTAMNPSHDEKARRFMESLGFNDPCESMKDLSELVFGKTGAPPDLVIHPSITVFLPNLLKALSDLPDPGGTLKHFKLIADSYNARLVLFDILKSNPKFFELLINIAQGTVYLTTMLISDPSLLDWLMEARKLLDTINTRNLTKKLDDIDARTLNDSAYTQECFSTKLREELRIGTRDISGLSSLEETFAELSAVASSIVQSAFRRAYRDVLAQTPSLRSGYAFSVIAAGKLGSGMMNFGSDLDLIFVYKSAGRDSAAIELPERSIRLAQKIISLITGGGGACKIYDIDARLRPEGGNSPLAISLDEYRRYCDRRASVWERLALVRARHLTGTGAIAGSITETLEGFVYRRPFFRSEVEEIMTMRTTIAENAARKYPGLINVKSGEGGITDIDFIAQSHATHYGAEVHGVRHHDTVQILKALASENIVPRHDTASLLESYSFFCTVEKAIRIGSGKPVNTLPKSGRELARIARLASFENVRKFERRLRDTLTLTRELYERLMGLLRASARVSQK